METLLEIKLKKKVIMVNVVHMSSINHAIAILVESLHQYYIDTVHACLQNLFVAYLSVEVHFRV